MVLNDLRARTIALRGDVDFTTAPKLAHLCASFAACDVIVLDLSGTGFVDTTFLRFLIQLRKQAREQVPDPVRLVAPAERARRILEVTGLIRRFAVYDTVLAATRDVQFVDELPALLAS